MAENGAPQTTTEGAGAQPGSDANAGTTVLTTGSDPGAGGNTTTGDGKAAGDVGAGDGGPDGKGGDANPDGTKPDDKKSEGAPEKYEFQMPEGVTLDEGALQAFEPALRELNLSNEQAQKLVEKFAAWRSAEAQAAEDAYVRQAETWGQQTREDPEIGGAAFDTNVVIAQRAITQFGSDDLKALLESTGLGNHPTLVKFCVRIGKALGEDGVAGTGSPGRQLSRAEKLYPSMNKG